MHSKNKLPISRGEEIWHIKFGKGIVKKIDIKNGYIYVLFKEHKTKYFMIEKFYKYFKINNVNKITNSNNTANNLSKLEKNKILTLFKIECGINSEFRFKGFYHMTTANNLISIAQDRKLYCRNRNKMVEDMASNIKITKSIVSKTSKEMKNYVSFYFRPKTPTYYYFEKFHDDLCLLKFKKNILFREGAKISVGSSAKINKKLLNIKYEELKNLNIEKIFLRSGNYEDYEEKNLRDSELLIPDSIDIDNIEEYIFKNKKTMMFVYKELKIRGIKLPSGEFVLDKSTFNEHL